MATSFTVNKADLEFILKQIKISEATSAGYTATPVSILQAIMNATGSTAAVASQLPYGLRTVDGTYNSLLPGQDKLGAADTLFPRLTDPVFRNDADGDTMPLGPGAPTITNTDYGKAGSVADADPRTISNLIVDMSVNNPAAIDAFLNNPLAVAAFEEEQGFAPTKAWLIDPAHVTEANKALQTVPNQSPDIGLSPGFNSWMTFFGQFFDHGLDLVTKGKNGTVYIPLQPDDPLYDFGNDGTVSADDGSGADGVFGTTDDSMNFMALTRATVTLDANGQPQHENTTTSFVDQNQTYTSHPSHQVFLREYATVNGKTVTTGRLLDGTAASGSVDGAIGNWAEVKAQALQYLGINLSDFDIHNVPLLATDQYGKFIPGPNGYAQIVMAPDATHATNWLKEGNPDGSVTTAGSIGSNHAFLNDIAHHAAPGTYDPDHNPITDNSVQQTADVDVDLDGDGVISLAEKIADDHDPSTYDNELLDAHFITGDGRGNENVALTTVHSIFHAEHNRLVEANKSTILQASDLNFLNEWLLVDVTAIPTDPAEIAGLTWDGERLFQAARFGTEMQYQHLVFEEFARRIQPMVDPFVFNNSPNVDPSILAEFAHTVYRFGHSMLTGTVDRLDNNLNPLNGDVDQKTLLAMFLNPTAYIQSGETIQEINANFIRGLSRDVGNAIDEFIVTNVRSQLLGLPLDLGALNIARGRDTGIPSLQETRTQLYNDTGIADLKPYTSWYDFALNLKNSASVINFIAAYGTHQTIIDATTMAEKRAAAEAIVFAGADTPPDRLDFLHGTGAYANDLGGLNSVDLWIGGLAEASPEFGGMLGTTFNYVFEFQMEALQNGDRLYYLSRTQGLNFLNNLEPNSFADLVMRNTELGDEYSTHLNGQLFVTPDHIIELDSGIAQEDYNGAAAGKDPLWDGSNPTLEALQGPKIVRNYNIPGHTTVDVNGVTHDVGGYLRVVGGEHYVLGGTEGNDQIYGDRGIDTLWGDGGNDYLNGMTESDDVFGGGGDDIIEDPFGDDVLRGNQGNDVITSARGADLLFGDQGQDYIIVGQDAAEAFGGTESDFILGGNGGDFLLGNEGDDWIEGGGGFDTIAGDNSELFFNSPIIGHDVMFGQGDEQDYDAESGDDIMGSGPSVFRYEGMFGFDWGIAKFDVAGVDFDLKRPIFTTDPNDILRDRFDQVEALSGWVFGDHLDGDDRGHTAGVSTPGAAPAADFVDHVLNTEGIDRITGMRQLLGGTADLSAPMKGLDTLFGPGTTTFRDGNILLGGDGNDFLRGRGGFDILDGDAWLNVRINIVIPAGRPNAGTYSAESMTSDTAFGGPNAGKVFNTFPDGSPNFNSPAFGGRSLNSLILDRTINPGDLHIVREILTDTTDPTGANANIDTAIFQGNELEYDIEGTEIVYGPDGVPTHRTGAIRDVDGDGFIKIRDLDDGVVAAPGFTNSRNTLTDDTDLLKNIELLQFADKTVDIRVAPPTGPASVTLAALAEDTTRIIAEADLLLGWSDLNGDTLTVQDLQASSGTLIGNGDGTWGFTPDANDNTSVTFTYKVSDGTVTVPAGAEMDLTPVNDAPTGALVISDTTPTEGSAITVSTADIADPDGIPATFGYQWQVSTNNGGTWGNIAGATNATFTPAQAQVGGLLRVVVSYTDLGGTNESVTSAATAVVGDLNGAVLATFNGTAGADIATAVNGLNITLNGNAGDDILNGGNPFPIFGGGNNILNGGAGNDTLNGNGGNDTLNGQDGDDTVIGGAGADTMSGGIGVDTFQFDDNQTGIAPATRDLITDFEQGSDRLDLRQIDAIAGGLDQDFSFIGGPTANFTAAGQLRYRHETVGGVVHTIVEGNVNANTAADFQIALRGQFNLAAGDFLGLIAPAALTTARTAVLSENVAAGTAVATLASSAPNSSGPATFSLQGAQAALYTIEGNQVVLRQGAVVDYEQARTHQLTVQCTTDSGETYEESFTVQVQNVKGIVKSGSSRSESLVGTGEEDTIKAGAGNDKLYGKDGNDKLYGEDGNDRLEGGAGDDILSGGRGLDRLIGGAGKDIFVFEHGKEWDHVVDFRNGHDKLDVSRLAGVDKFADLWIMQSGANTLVCHGMDVLVLDGVSARDLDSSDFVF